MWRGRDLGCYVQVVVSSSCSLYNRSLEGREQIPLLSAVSSFLLQLGFGARL